MQRLVPHVLTEEGLVVDAGVRPEAARVHGHGQGHVGHEQRHQEHSHVQHLARQQCVVGLQLQINNWE